MKAQSTEEDFSIREFMANALTQKLKNQKSCAGCVIILTTMLNYVNLHNIDLNSFMHDTYPSWFKQPMDLTVKLIVDLYGPDVEKYFQAGQSPD